MALKPATPLTILLLASFVLLLISTISTPIVHGIPIASFKGYNFGVFGYCNTGDGSCSKIVIGYTTNTLFGGTTDSGDFNVPSSTRHSLSSLLIVTPIAAFFNLVCLALAAAAHIHSPSHSARYLLGLLVLLLPTLLITLLAFLVDILLFAPHLSWGGWIVLGSVILVFLSGILTCAMRRTLVARKARKRRIAENAEMSGENFYNRQAQEAKMVSPVSSSNAAPKTMVVDGAPGPDVEPSFATFQTRRRNSDDDRKPLNSRAASNPPAGMVRDGDSSRYYNQNMRSRSQGPYSSARDEFGNPIPPSVGTSTAFDSDSSMVARIPSSERRRPSFEQYRANGYGPSRGAGYGPPRGRAGYPPRGSYGPRGGYGGQGPSSQGYRGHGGYPGDGRGINFSRGRGYHPMSGAAMGAGAGMAAGAMMNRGPRQPPPGYPQQGRPPNRYPSEAGKNRLVGPVEGVAAGPYGPPVATSYDPILPTDHDRSPEDAVAGYGASQRSPIRERQSPYDNQRQSPPPPMPRGPGGPPPTDQTTEMDATRPPVGYGPPPTALRDSDADIEGMVSLQQDHATTAGMYSRNDYLPPRTAWTAADPHNPPISSDLRRREQSPVELRTDQSQVGSPSSSYSPAPKHNSPTHARVNSGSDHYYEDVNPRFATDPPSPGPPPAPAPTIPLPIPGMLVPGRAHPHPLPSSSYEDLHAQQEGARSPAESETSNFTSVSQRGVNPNWKPGVGPDGFQNLGPPPPMAKRREQQMRRDVLLNGNPDFEILGMGAGRGGRRGGPMGMSTMSGGGSNIGPPGRAGPGSSVGMGMDSRYPGPP